MFDWITLLIIIAFTFYFFDGYKRGVINLTIELLGFFTAIFLAFKNYSWVGSWVSEALNLSTTLINPIGFLVVWLAVEFIFYLIGLITTLILPEQVKRSRIEHILGILPSGIKCFFLLSVVFSLVAALPVGGRFKESIVENPIASTLIQKVNFIESVSQETFGQSLDNTLTYLLSKPQESGDVVVLNFRTDNSTEDPTSEERMLDLLNKERIENGLSELTMDEKLREVARAHSRDMFSKGFFAHVNMEGQDPFDRMEDLRIVYTVAGENLAFAPNVEIAHVGLMNSPKHRDNILFGQFRKVGIGVIDAGIYGKMFSQEFSD